MKLELHINGECWDTAETTPSKWKWQLKEMQIRWQEALRVAEKWEAYITYPSKMKKEKTYLGPIYPRRIQPKNQTENKKP